MTFEQAVRSFGWADLAVFAKHVPETSATYRALHKEEYKFASDLQQSSMMADLYDAVQALLYMFAKAHGGKPQKPQPFPRPWTKDNTRRIGSDVNMSDEARSRQRMWFIAGKVF